MKKFTAMILALMLLCGVLSACGNGNISNDKGGKTTDSPNDAEDIIDDGDMTDNGILDGDKGGNNSNGGDKGGNNSNGGGNGNNNSGANDGGKDNTAPSSMPDESPAVATQTVTP